jgi:hypothetical protein
VDRKARLVGYLSVLIAVGLAFYALHEIGYLLIELGVVIVTTVPSRIRDIILGKKPEPSSTQVEKGLLIAEQFRRVSTDLHVHYEGVIDRMEKWEYYPSDTEESIYVGKNFYGLTPVQPQSLENDKMHLKEFSDAWGLYTEGRRLSAEARTAEESAIKLVTSHLEKPISIFQNWKENGNVDKLARAIIDESDYRFRGGRSRDFEAGTVLVNGVPFPAIGEHVLNNATLADVQKIVIEMNSIMSVLEIRDAVSIRRRAFDARLRNKSEFLETLTEKVILPAKDSNYTTPELRRGSCPNCSHLVQQLKSLEK